MSILVIEDLSPNRASLARGLCRLGHPVASASISDLRRALDQARGFATIVIDFERLNGPQLLLLHEVRNACPDARIVILSPSDQIHDRVVSLIQGADEILIKPFDLRGLDAVLRDDSGAGPGN